jgi:hypothetical protein
MLTDYSVQFPIPTRLAVKLKTKLKERLDSGDDDPSKSLGRRMVDLLKSEVERNVIENDKSLKDKCHVFDVVLAYRNWDLLETLRKRGKAVSS